MNYFLGKNTKSIFSVVLLVLLFSSCSSGPRYGDDPPNTQWNDRVDEKYTKNKSNGAASGALFWAVKHGDINGVGEALGKGADPNVSDNLGRSALMWACWKEMLDIVEALISNSKININQVSKSTENGKSNNYTALLCAAEVGNTEIFQKLIDKKANIELVDINQENILHKAVKSKNSRKMVEYILNYIVEPEKKPYKNTDHINAQDIKGFTSLHRAVEAIDYNIVKLLLDNNADAFKPANNDGQLIYPLKTAFEQGNYRYIYIPLLEKLSKENLDEILLYYRVVPIQDNLRENYKDILKEDDFRIIKTAIDNIDIFNIKEEIFPNRYPYIFSASQKIKGLQELLNENFIRDATNYFEAVKKGDRETFKELNGSIGKNLVNYGPESEEVILNAIANRDDETVYTLLGEGFRTLNNENKDALAFAAKVALEKDEKSYEILDYMLKNLYVYGNKLYSRNGTYEGETALAYILQNDDYLIKKGLKEIKHIFRQLWKFQDKNKEQIIFYIIELDTNNNNELIEIKRDLFDLVFNTEIERNRSRYYNKDIKRKYIKEHILVHLLQEKYYHGVNHLLIDQHHKPENLDREIRAQIRPLLPSLDEINGEGFELLEKFIQEVKPDN
jgi:ankyrin repeat protein